MRVLIIDNYDSFTYNLVHYVEQFANQVVVIRNDEPYQDELELADKLILSPGPGLPQDSGRLMEIIDKSIKKLPILGVCLGHQALGVYFGGELQNLRQVHHGVDSTLRIINHHDPLFSDISQNTKIGHYHSWVISNQNVPSCLEVTSFGLGDEIMSIKHKTLPIWGVQFHPESVLSEEGLQMVQNFIVQCNP